MTYLIFVLLCVFASGMASCIIAMLLDDHESVFFWYGIRAMGVSWIVGVGVGLFILGRLIL